MEHANWSPSREMVLYNPDQERYISSQESYNPFDKIIDDSNAEKYRIAFAKVQKNFEEYSKSGDLAPLGAEEKRIVVYKGEDEILAADSDVRSKTIAICSAIFTGASASGGGAAIAEYVGALIIYSNVATSATTSGTSMYALYSQYVLANMAASASTSILAVPVLGFTGTIAANALFGFGVSAIASKVIQYVYNFFVAKDPVEHIDISAKDLAIECAKSKISK